MLAACLVKDAALLDGSRRHPPGGGAIFANIQPLHNPKGKSVGVFS
jgi:hypothetical protein